MKMQCIDAGHAFFIKIKSIKTPKNRAKTASNLYY
jgi:hypothetical protein